MKCSTRKKLTLRAHVRVRGRIENKNGSLAVIRNQYTMFFLPSTAAITTRNKAVSVAFVKLEHSK